MAQSAFQLSTKGLKPFLTASPSAASSVTITGLSAASFAYIVDYNLTMGTDNVNLRVRTSSNGGVSYDSGASDYSASIKFNSTDSVSNGRSDINLVSAGVGAAANEGISGQFMIINPSGTSYTRLIGISTYTSHIPTKLTGAYGGTRNSAADVDAIEISATSGTISGFVNVFALAI